MTRTLDPQARDLLDELAAIGFPPSAALSVAGARRRPRDFPELFERDGPPEPVEVVRDVLLAGPGGDLPVRVYAPHVDGPLPALVYLHGGGWVLGDLASRDGFCRAIANAASLVVIAVDYRLAPEHPFPAALLDAHAAVSWVTDRAAVLGVDPDRIAIGGDSAGGNLAAATALLARDRGGPAIRHQLLVYPALEHAFDTTSYRENATGYFLTRENMEWYWDHYLRHEIDGRHPYASPLRARTLEGLPSATIITCEFDPLRDEGVAYADRLRGDGVAVEHVHYEDMIHGFLTFAHRLDAADRAVDRMAAELRSALGS